MDRNVTMWIFVIMTIALIAGVWSFIFYKSLGRSFFATKPTENPEVQKTFRELENAIKGFKSINTEYFKAKSAEASKDLEKNATLERLKEKLISENGNLIASERE